VALFFIGAGRTLSVDDWIGRWRRLRGRDKRVGRDRLGLKRHSMGENGLGQQRDHALGMAGVGQDDYAQTLLWQQHPLDGVTEAVAAVAHDARRSGHALLLEEDAEADAQALVKRDIGILRLDHRLDQAGRDELSALEPIQHGLRVDPVTGLDAQAQPSGRISSNEAGSNRGGGVIGTGVSSTKVAVGSLSCWSRLRSSRWRLRSPRLSRSRRVTRDNPWRSMSAIASIQSNSGMRSPGRLHCQIAAMDVPS